MAQRENHYEAALEAFLRQRGTAYLAIDEARRSVLAARDAPALELPTAGGALADCAHRDTTLKNLDFVVSSVQGTQWLVDVKGRFFPTGGKNKQYWKNWSTRDDLVSLSRWEHLFGARSQGLFVFAYLIVGERAPLPADQLFTFRGRSYGFVAMRLQDYVSLARPLSARWDTWSVPATQFRRYARALAELL
jgi:hypothetical protein